METMARAIIAMKRKPTVSIGIPAYNEEANIAFLLRSLLVQTQKSYVLKEIVVFSDGSTDQTNARVLSLKDKRVTLLSHTKRLGLNTAQNILFKNVHGDILVIINGDVIVKGKGYIDTLISPLLNNSSVGLVGSDFWSLRMSRGWGRIFGNASDMRRYIYAKCLLPNNVYLCHGCSRAFSKSLYTKIRWPQDVPEDAYSYFFALSHGYKFIYNKEAKVFVHPSTTVSDHIRQSTRFVKGVSRLTNYFDKELIASSYHIPRLRLIMAVFLHALKKPFSIPTYFIIMILIRFINFFNYEEQNKFRISETTKKWHRETLIYNGIRLKKNIFQRTI